MTRQFVILCSAQRLPYQDTVDQFAFGLNITAAIGLTPDEGSVTPQEAIALRPWAWAGITHVRVANDASGAGASSIEILHPPSGASIPDVDFPALLTALNETEYNPANECDLDAVTAWPLPETTRVVRNVPMDFATTGRRKRWHASILELSTKSYPIPQKLNLSFIVRIPNTISGTVYIAPVIPDTTLFAAQTMPVGGLLPTADNRVVQWKYDQPTKSGLEVAAYLLPVEIEPARLPSETLIDLKTGWVRDAKQYEEDWRAFLEKRAGEVFDLAERLIDFLRDRMESLRAEPAVLPYLTKATISVMRDLAGTGLLPSINMKTFREGGSGQPAFLDGNTLPDDLLGPDPKNKLNRPQLELLRETERKLFGIDVNVDGDTKWRAFLRANLSQVAGLKILLGGGNDPSTETPQLAEDCLSELEQLHKALLDPQNLHSIVQKQWELIFKDLEPLPSWAVKLREKIIALPSDFDYRRRFALRCLAPAWVALRNQAISNPGADVDLRTLIPALLINHLQARLQLPQTKTPTVDATSYSGFLPECDMRNQKSLQCAPAGGPSPLISCVVADLEQPDPDGKTKLSRLVENLAPASGTLEKTTDIPHGITLQPHLNTALPEETTAFTDVLNHISGVLVFMRVTGGPWRCLNYARANVRNSSFDKNNLITVPTRISYQNDFTQSLITYNNLPLGAKSPLALLPRVAGNGDISPNNGLLNSAVNATPLIEYDYSTDDRARIPALVFGTTSQTYDVAMCTVSASGALPKEISDPDRPWEISPTKLATLDFGSGSPIKKTFNYQRKVPVGEIRNKSLLIPGTDDSTRSNLNLLRLPKIPARVYPRAVELPPFSAAAGATPRILADEMPLLLLAPPSQDKWGVEEAFEFRLRKPATDIETWHRWVNDRNPSNLNCDGNHRNNRVCVLRDYYQTLEKNHALPKNISAHEISIDDPAVNGFYAQLRKFDPNSRRWGEPFATKRIEMRPPLTPASLGDVQSAPARFVCKSSETAEGFQDLPGGTDTQVNCLKGNIYWLCVHATVDGTTAATRFSNVVKFERNVPGVGQLTHPFELLIEVGTSELPSEKELWESLKPKFIAGDRGDRVEVSIETAVNKFIHVHKAELHRQTWYWQGRETRAFPAFSVASTFDPDLLNPVVPASGAGLSDEVRKWEEFEFAARDSLDFSIHDFKRVADSGLAAPTTLPPGSRRWFSYVDQLTPETQSNRSDGTQEKGDLRAHYYRFSAQVISRYEGIFPSSSSPIKQALNPQDLPNELKKWRRLFVHCRRTLPPPLPKVKLILPLTESHLGLDGTRSPGLLVVLDESWYEFGGLGESITAEIELLDDPHNPDPNDPTFQDPCPVSAGNRTRFYFELGPDPIMASTTNVLPQSDSGSTSFSTAKINRIRGPVGHTHDDKDLGALFTATSFIIPAPEILNRTQAGVQRVTDLSWYMCKIRLRRKMLLKDPRNAGPATVMLSEPTEAQWVQYLPEFSLFAGDLTVEKLFIEFVDDSKVVIKKSATSIVKPADLSGTVENGNKVLTPVLLLTRGAFNASGEPNDEVYVGMCWPKEGQNFFELLPETSGGTASVAGLRANSDIHFSARVLGVQGVPVLDPATSQFKPMPRPESSKDFCDRLFAYNEQDKTNGKPMSDANRPRVVRISQPIRDQRQ
jgi:hypothetical protein